MLLHPVAAVLAALFATSIAGKGHKSGGWKTEAKYENVDDVTLIQATTDTSGNKGVESEEADWNPFSKEKPFAYNEKPLSMASKVKRKLFSCSLGGGGMFSSPSQEYVDLNATLYKHGVNLDEVSIKHVAPELAKDSYTICSADQFVIKQYKKKSTDNCPLINKLGSSHFCPCTFSSVHYYARPHLEEFGEGAALAWMNKFAEEAARSAGSSFDFDAWVLKDVEAMLRALIKHGVVHLGIKADNMAFFKADGKQRFPNLALLDHAHMTKSPYITNTMSDTSSYLHQPPEWHKIKNSTPSSTNEMWVKGKGDTPYYDHTADVWAAGITMIELMHAKLNSTRTVRERELAVEKAEDRKHKLGKEVTDMGVCLLRTAQWLKHMKGEEIVYTGFTMTGELEQANNELADKVFSVCVLAWECNDIKWFLKIMSEFLCDHDCRKNTVNQLTGEPKAYLKGYTVKKGVLERARDMVMGVLAAEDTTTYVRLGQCKDIVTGPSIVED